MCIARECPLDHRPSFLSLGLRTATECYSIANAAKRKNDFVVIHWPLNLYRCNSSLRLNDYNRSDHASPPTLSAPAGGSSHAPLLLMGKGVAADFVAGQRHKSARLG